MPKRLYKILLVLGIIATIVAIILFLIYYNSPKNLEVDFLDVGQGDSILIKTPYGQNILIDGGPNDGVIDNLSKKLSWYDRRIDLMILTHPHDDHVTGLVDVLKRYDVKKILYTGVVHNAPNYLEWLEIIQNKKIPLVIIDRPQQISLGADCSFDILYPQESILGQAVSNLNNSSIVSLLDCKKKKFLFMGDAEKEVEEELLSLDLSEDIKEIDVLKVGHHGSDTSSSEDFLNLTKPKIVIIQVGADNDFGHPSLRIIKRLERVGAEILRNDEIGTIGIKVVNDELLIENCK